MYISAANPLKWEAVFSPASGWRQKEQLLKAGSLWTALNTVPVSLPLPD